MQILCAKTSPITLQDKLIYYAYGRRSRGEVARCAGGGDGARRRGMQSSLSVTRFFLITEGEVFRSPKDTLGEVSGPRLSLCCL